MFHGCLTQPQGIFTCIYEEKTTRLFLFAIGRTSNPDLNMRSFDWAVTITPSLIGWEWRGQKRKPNLVYAFNWHVVHNNSRVHVVNMAVTDMSSVLDILRSLYRHTQTLEEFADSIVFKEGHKALLSEESDTNRFKSFVRGVFVCFDKELQQIPSCNQASSL